MKKISRAVSNARLLFTILSIIPPTSLLAGTVNIVTPSKIIKVPIKSFTEIRSENMVRQHYDYSCGTSSLATILNFFYQKPVSESQIIKWILIKKGLISKKCPQKLEKCKITKKPQELENKDFMLSFWDLANFSKKLGFKPVALAIDIKTLLQLKVPAIVYVRPRKWDSHFSVYKGTDGKFVYLADPSYGNIMIKLSKFKSIFYLKEYNFKKGRILALIPQKPVKTNKNFMITQKENPHSNVYKVIKNHTIE
jgi:predicted double-glycine peptidase